MVNFFNKNQKNYIHETISKDFGKKQYKDKYGIKKSNYDDINKYSEDALNYKQKVLAFNQINGVTATEIDVTEGVDLSIKLDSKSIDKKDYDTMEERNYYKADTEAKTISFEMNSRGYICK